MGLGDAIMATAQARAMKKKYPDAKVTVGNGSKVFWSEIFNNNPDITRPEDLKPGDMVAWVRNHVGNRPYIDYDKTTADKLVYREDFRAEPGRLIIQDDAKQYADDVLGDLKDFVIVEPNTKGTFSDNKAWPWVHWQGLVDILNKRVPLVQIGSASKETLADVKRVVTPEFKTALAILARAKLLVTTDGALHHAAAALGIPAIVIWGARTDPKILGYESHTNVFNGDGSCGSVAPCEHCKNAMWAIKPSYIAALVEEQCK